jgi:hypothetical protein
MACDRRTDGFVQPLQFESLVLGQRFCREQINCPARGIRKQRIQNRKVVAQRLTACGGSYDRNVAALKRVLDCCRLVNI